MNSTKAKKKHRSTLTLCHFFLTLKQNTSTFISHRSQQNMRLDVMTNAMKSSKSTKKNMVAVHKTSHFVHALQRLV